MYMNLSVQKTYFNHMSKVLPFDVVICFDEDLSQSAFSYRVVLGVELVKSMKGVPVLQQSSLFRFQGNVSQTSQYKTLIALFTNFFTSN